MKVYNRPNKNKAWTGKDVKTLRELYPKHNYSEIAQIMNISASKVKAAIYRYNIKSGRTGQFEKGQQPHNKGKKGIMSPKCLQTAFKPGNLPVNTKYNGCISVRYDSGKFYKFIRIEKAKWELLHRYNWQKLFGPIPEGSIIVFRDGDSMNCDPANLELITRAEHVKRNANRKKGAEAMKKLWERERLRKMYGLSPLTGLGKRVVNF